MKRWLALVLLAGCGAPSGAAPPSFATSTGVASESAREAHLLGVTEAALPELAPLWPALSARAATEVVESLSVGEEGAAVHCLQVIVAGDLAQEALEAWREGARGLECEGDASDERCRGERTALRITSDTGAIDEEVAALDAIAAEMGMPPEPSATVAACVEGLSRARLARIDERLHVAGLLEPWHELHERLGARRFAELRWTRSERGTEVAVRYHADEEALELASEWARASGLAADDGAWRWIDAAMRLALELRPGPTPSIELLLVREP
jgi:hypothetical protein